MADVAAAGRGDESADAVILRRGEDIEVARAGLHAVLKHNLQSVRLLIDEQHRKVIVFEQVVHVAQDLLLQQRDSLLDVHAGDRLSVELHEIAAREVDRVDLLLHAPRRRDIPHHGSDLREMVFLVADGRDGNFEEMLVLNGEAEAAGPMVGGLVLLVLVQLLGCLHAYVADLLHQLQRESLHLRVRPDQSALRVDDTDALADRFENHGRLLVYGRALQRHEVALITDHEIERPLAQCRQRLVEGTDQTYVGIGWELCHDRGTLLARSRQQQNPRIGNGRVHHRASHSVGSWMHHIVTDGAGSRPRSPAPSNRRIVIFPRKKYRTSMIPQVHS